MNEYNFDSENHIHTLDGTPLHGVTTVLQIISKPALIQWAANMATTYASEHIEAGKAYGDKELETIFKEAKFAHKKKKEKGGDWGHIVHEAIEKWAKTGKKPQGLNPEQQLCFDKFVKWIKDEKIWIIESEKHVYSKDLWIGGICDMIIQWNGKKYVADIKTSSAIYNEYFFQMAAYALCLEEGGKYKDIDGYLVINLKKDGTIDFKIATDMELNKRAFKAALELHKIINSLEK